MPITIDKPSKYFDTKLYTGTGSTLSISGINFSPDLVWVKRRDTTGGNKWTDTVRGAGIVLVSNATDAEFSQTGISSFNSDGFTVGTDSGDFNANGGTYASWNWRGSDSSAVSNTQGSITSTVSANTTSGFSIVTWSGSGTNDQTIGHGLGVAPSFIIHKNRTYGSGDATGHWIVKTKEKINSSGTGSILYLNQTNAYSDNVHGTLIPSGSTLLQVKGGSGSPSDFWVNASGSNYVAYCFAEVKGYSAFGSYTGNGSTDGTFIYTGFTPAFVMIKQTSSAGEGWEMGDNKRSTYNVITTFLRGNSSAAESTNTDRQYDFLSNGIKMRGSHGSTNGSGSTYIYMCFAENPFVSSKGIPTTAR